MSSLTKGYKGGPKGSLIRGPSVLAVACTASLLCANILRKDKATATEIIVQTEKNLKMKK
jgi:hypothetical protein